MKTDEELLREIETADDGRGPDPIASYDGTALDEIMTLVEDRDCLEGRLSEAVTRARQEGATWAMIGQALRMTRQGALKHYREPQYV